ncbi:50S ribosomal protein L7/L12 [Candidatus Liberibacter sp.]|uniref:50S ribosomal protein L7/L12 n=1 Tax=Candidatus Liberibacter sp. TaxID=34022 RepID=UPI0015F65DF2|nr:50S ribosomal protein L7/L12 [Candidatus Liberibacter sp.]MBA5724521.1 50S ribosomal protein L7/L12 [Candidatus Liberibacter sp.]
MPDIESIVEKLSSLTLVQAAELSKALEEKWGVSAAAPVSVASAVAAGGDSAAPEKMEFDVVLTGFDTKNKISVIKEIRSITSLGLKEAKDLVEASPKTIKVGISKVEAEDIKNKLDAIAGTKVEIR